MADSLLAGAVAAVGYHGDRGQSPGEPQGLLEGAVLGAGGQARDSKEALRAKGVLSVCHTP